MQVLRKIFAQKESSNLPLVKPASDPLTFGKYIFVCGLHRSGTTLLENHLKSRFDLTALEAPVPENEGQHLQDVFPAALMHGGPGRFAFAPEMRMPGAVGNADEMRHRLLQCWTPWLTGKTDTLLEKSPPNLTKIGWLRAVFPGARFLIMTRDPRAVAGATAKWSHTSVEELIFHWHVAHSAALEDEGDDCMRLRYEDYCEAPEKELARIAQFLELGLNKDQKSCDQRFATLSNSNPKYLDGMPVLHLGRGVWEQFGYEIR